MACDQVPSGRCYTIKSKILDGAEISSCALSYLLCRAETVHWFCSAEKQLDKHGFTANYRHALEGLSLGRAFPLLTASTVLLCAVISVPLVGSGSFDL